MPVYEVEKAIFRKTIKSITTQSYPNWLVSIHVDEESEKKLDGAIESFRESFPDRVLISRSPKPAGISESLNKAITGADPKTEIVALLDCDDELHPDALMCVAKEFTSGKNPSLFYSDEDKLDKEGRHVDPHYKPDISGEMLLSQNFPCHLMAASMVLLKEMGPGIFRKEYDGAQDHDFWLRALDKVGPYRIVHCPRILYHWRKTKGSAAENIMAKPWALEAGLRTVKEHVFRIDPQAEVYRGRYPGTYRVRRSVMNFPDVLIIIPTRDNPKMLRNCIESIMPSMKPSAYDGYVRICVVDNGSSPENAKEIASIGKRLRSRYIVHEDPRPFSWSALNNTAANRLFEGCVRDDPVTHPLFHESAFIFMNDDVEALDPWWLEEMMRELWQTEVSIVGPKLLYPDMRIQHAGVVIGMGGIAGHAHKRQPDGQSGYFSRAHITQQVSAVTGACMAVRVKTFFDLGGFEEALPKAFNDIDFCLKARAKGYKVIYTPWARLVHHESVSRGIDPGGDPIFQAAVRYMDEKWHCRTMKDPFFNPNFDLMSEMFRPS